MDTELTEAEVEALEKLNAQVQNIIKSMRIQAVYQAEQTDLMKNMMRGMIQDVRALKHHPDYAVESPTPSTEPYQVLDISVTPDSVTKNTTSFVEDCQNDAEEKSSSEHHEIVSSSTEPNLIFKDEMKIVSAVDAEDSDDIDSEVDKYSDSVLAKLTGFGIVHKEIFSIDSSSSLVLQKHESKDENVESGVGTLARALNDSLKVCPPSVRQNVCEILRFLLPPAKPPDSILRCVSTVESTCLEVTADYKYSDQGYLNLKNVMGLMCVPYPCVFDHLGKIYMMPASSQKGELRFYRALNFTLEWKLGKGTLDKPPVDVNIIFHGGMYWLLGSDHRRYGVQKNGELDIYYGSSPLGPWRQSEFEVVVLRPLSALVDLNGIKKKSNGRNFVIWQQNMLLKDIRKYLAKKNGYGVLNTVDDKYVVGLLKELFVVSPRESVRKHWIGGKAIHARKHWIGGKANHASHVVVVAQVNMIGEAKEMKLSETVLLLDFILGDLYTFGNKGRTMLQLGLTTNMVDVGEEFNNALIVDEQLHDEVTDSVGLPRFATNIFMFSVPRPPEIASFWLPLSFWFSSPRPPEVANLEDKVLSEGGSIVTNKEAHGNYGKGKRQRMASLKIPLTIICYGSAQRGGEGKGRVTWTNRLAM